MSDLYMKVRNLPMKVENARRRIKELKAEAKRLGVRDIHNRLSVVDDAWDREVETAQLKAQMRGEEYSMGVDDV